MRYPLLLLTTLATLASCSPKNPELPSACTGFTRAQFISKELAVVRLQKGSGPTAGSYVLLPLSEAYRSHIVSWVPCNLPAQFQQDNLDVTISGYKLLRAGAQIASTEAMSFEITDIKLRE